MPNTILLKGHGQQKEGVASSTITPGDLVEFGGANDLQRHSTLGGTARHAFAMENDLIGGGIDDDYLVNQTVRYQIMHSGSDVYAKLAAGQTCTKGQALQSAGTGKLQPASSHEYATSVVAWALETITVAGSRVKVEVA